MKSRLLLAMSFLSLFGLRAKADVTLPSIFSDHMVLQRNAEVTIFGQAKPYETVTVTTSWNDEAPSVLVGRDSRFAIKIHTPGAGGPHTLTVAGFNKIVINDILIGEIWLASGQSNMEFSTDWIHNFAGDIRAGKMPRSFDPDKAEAEAEAQIARADHPEIRFFATAQVQSECPQLDAKGRWVVCTPETMRHFSLLAYFFGEKLNAALKVPVGLINSSWGGTPADVWTPREAMMADPVLADFAAKRDPNTWGPHDPGVLFNTMIAPIVPYRIAGVIWNQGEENVGQSRGDEVYARLFAAMVASWREKWGYDFPVLYVQIPPYRYDADNANAFRAAVLRDEQRRALTLIPQSFMVVASDVAEPENIHPIDKLTPGTRLADWALREVYHVAAPVPCGPLYAGMTVEGSSIRICFTHAEGGLRSLDGKPLTSFEIAGKDMVFHPAQAVIEGETVLVSSSEVPEPKAVRFAFRDDAMPNLAGGTGLPASTFRTDDGPL
jgi:sialate O-acetylesterase